MPDCTVILFCGKGCCLAAMISLFERGQIKREIYKRKATKKTARTSGFNVLIRLFFVGFFFEKSGCLFDLLRFEKVADFAEQIVCRFGLVLSSFCRFFFRRFDNLYGFRFGLPLYL